ncbi:type I glyceraldehyde-3-phosphate dehydrogenase [Candidatus Woesearchaeota archaeon]|nr:type I glyceraldehyde-3-phosphate dehydrogenase [Candidatus Woesearchaeota archaeon]
MVRVAINGFGRIGRMFLRAALNDKKVEVVAVNDLSDAATLAYLFKYDSVHGTFGGEVRASKGSLLVNGKSIRVLNEKLPENLPWRELKVDVVAECTGLFTSRADAEKHIAAGAGKVLLSAPPKDESCPTIVKGVNDEECSGKDARSCIISNASCTTNSLAPVVDVLHKNFRIVHGFITTIHAYTNDQRILDVSHKDLRRARAAARNIIPTSTGAAKTIHQVIPELKGKLDGIAMRVPVPCASVTDLTCEVEKGTTVEEVNNAFKKASSSYLKGILQYVDEPIVSSDIIGNPHSSVFDSLLTKVIGGSLVKVVAWYDNEWGFSCRMVDVVKMLA